jgi:transposase
LTRRLLWLGQRHADAVLHRNVLAIALANKLARIAWSVLAHGRSFEASKLAEAATQSA